MMLLKGIGCLELWGCALSLCKIFISRSKMTSMSLFFALVRSLRENYCKVISTLFKKEVISSSFEAEGGLMGTWATGIYKYLIASLYNSSLASSISLASVTFFDLGFFVGAWLILSHIYIQRACLGVNIVIPFDEQHALKYRQEHEYTESVPVLLTLLPSSLFPLDFPQENGFRFVPSFLTSCTLRPGRSKIVLISRPPQVPTLSPPCPAAQFKKYKFYS